MKVVRIAFAVEFVGTPLLLGFLPREDAPLRFSMGNAIVLAFSDAPAGEIAPERSVSWGPLKLVVEEPMSTELAAAVHAGQRGGQIEAWGRAFLRRLDNFLGSLTDYFRNVQGQFWVVRPEVDHAIPDYALRALKATVISGEHPRDLWVESAVYLPGKITVRSSTVQDKDRENLEQFVSAGRRSAAWQEFLSNARSELAAGSFRGAVVESVTALEAAIRQLYPTILFKKIGGADVTPKDLDRLVERAGLRVTAAVFLRITLRQAGWDDGQIARLLDAIDLRNELVHGGRRSAEEPRAHAVVEVISKALDALRSMGA